VKLALKVFCYGFLIDVMYVIWIKAVASGSALLAGTAAVGLTLPGLLGYMEILSNKKLMYPYLFGLFLGTVCGTLLHDYIGAV
jgi:hypothetical protein